MIRISTTDVRVIDVHDDDPIAGEPERLPLTRHVVTLEIRTADGITGIGFAFCNPVATAALRDLVAGLAALTHGEDPIRVEHVMHKLRVAAGPEASSGLVLMAMSAIDTALWDIRGKVAGEPLWKLLGGTRARISTYASGPVRRELTDDDAVVAAGRIVEKGFHTVKMHLALNAPTSPAREVERARRVRDAVGPDVRLVCDVNERWRPDEAISLGSQLEEIGFYWLEDPTRHDDFAGLARVTSALSTSIMAGENLWGMAPFREMIARHSVDIVMMDIMRVGGVSPWMKVAAMAEAFNLPVVSHLMPEIQAHIVAAVPNGLYAEFKSWTWRLFEEVPRFERGEFVLPERPGLGLAFAPDLRPSVM